MTPTSPIDPSAASNPARRSDSRSAGASAVPLLVATLVQLRHPCTRNRLAAVRLLRSAACLDGLAPLEREACLELAEELETRPAYDYSSPSPAHRGA